MTPPAIKLVSDTVSVREAAARFGISKTLAYELAKAGRPLTKGVPILKFGSDARPVYRVSKRAIDRALGGS